MNRALIDTDILTYFLKGDPDVVQNLYQSYINIMQSIIGQTKGNYGQTLRWDYPRSSVTSSFNFGI